MNDRSTRRSWLTLAAFAALGGTTQCLWLTYAPVTTAAAARYDVSETAIGWLANVFPLWYVLLAVPAGLALDRWLRPALAVGAVLTALGGCVRLLGDDYLVALAGQTLVALAQPLVLTAITPVAARYLTARDRATGIALASAATFGGMIAAFAIATLTTLGTALVVGAVLGVASAVAVLVALRQRPTYDAEPGGLTDFARAWRHPVVRRVCLLVPIPFGTFTALTTWGQALLEPAGVSADQAGVLLLVNVVAGVVGCAVVPVWAARAGRENATLAVAVAATVTACVVLAVAPSTASGLVCFLVVGAALLPALPIVLEQSERAAGTYAGAAAGLVWLAGQLGALVVTGLAGLLVGVPAIAFLALAALTASGVLALPRPLRQPDPAR